MSLERTIGDGVILTKWQVMDGPICIKIMATKLARNCAISPFASMNEIKNDKERTREEINVQASAHVSASVTGGLD